MKQQMLYIAIEKTMRITEVNRNILFKTYKIFINTYVLSFFNTFHVQTTTTKKKKKKKRLCNECFIECDIITQPLNAC